jgi:phospholipid/cholesterol/gamma-HCH transport system substrate-binding protein
LIVIAVVGASLAGAFLLTGASDKANKRTYNVELDNAFGLVEGGDFRVGGVRAGKTTSFSIEKRRGRPAKAVAIVEISEPGFDDFRSDASCEVRPQSLIGEYYLDCQPGSSKRKLARDGSGTVPVRQTASTIPTDLVNNIMRRPYRERLRFIINELGTGLAGRPQDLQQVLRRAHPGLRETTRVLRILGNQNRVIENFIRDSDTVVGELTAKRRDVVRWVQEAGDAAEISASRSAALREGFRKLPTFLGELRPTMARTGQLIDAQRPLLGDLRRAAPSLTTFFERLGPFSQASRPALRTLGEASAMGTRAFRAGGQEIAELNSLAPKARPTFKPLRQFLQTADDRRRAIDRDDNRAAVGGPPAPDPTHIGPGDNKGFTGLEAVWNYPFWQGLSINGYDDVSHLLRISITADHYCAELHNEIKPEEKADFERCSQWLGPNLPGITTPDFTDDPRTLARMQRESRQPADRVGERRQAGQVEAGPRPGQRDISRPQIVVPPRVRQLIDRLSPEDRKRLRLPRVPGAAPRVPDVNRRVPDATDPQSGQDLLDFLLTP